jgi:hypothetical protein
VNFSEKFTQNEENGRSAKERAAVAKHWKSNDALKMRQDFSRALYSPLRIGENLLRNQRRICRYREVLGSNPSQGIQASVMFPDIIDINDAG